MIVKSMNESAIYAIGHAFGYYDYGEETGMVYAFFGQEPTAQYICAYVRGMLRGGFLHTTSERGEGYIAYKRPKEKLGFKTLWPIATGMLHNSSMKRLMRFAMAIKKGGKSLQERMDKEKKPSSAWSACAKSIRGRAICERSWTSPLPRATASVCR